MYPLTTPQQNIWNLQKYYEGTSISNLCGAVFFGKPLDIDVLSKAINTEIECQQGLRLRFKEENGEAVQYIFPYSFNEIPCVSFSCIDSFEKFAKEYAKEPIGMIEQQMYDFCIFDIAGKTGVIMKVSHLISDAWSFSLLQVIQPMKRQL